jgi:hypothetical protein
VARFAAGAYAFLECRFQADRLVVLFQEILEGFVGNLLKGLSCWLATASMACHVSSSNCTRFPGMADPSV